MFPGINSRQAKQMMRKMGMKQEDIDAQQVIIKTNEKEIIINNPSVSKINMAGQETFQISGEISEQQLSSKPEISQDDIKTVADQTNKTEEEAKAAIEEADGDLAAAILKLKE